MPFHHVLYIFYRFTVQELLEVPFFTETTGFKIELVSEQQNGEDTQLTTDDDEPSDTPQEVTMKSLFILSPLIPEHSLLFQMGLTRFIHSFMSFVSLL